MGDRSGIEWTDASWNPVTGCTKVSPACAYCYAETFAERWRGTPGHPYEHGFDLVLRPERLDQPLRWTRPRRIFVNSMADLFHEEVPEEFISQVFDVMNRASWHTFQVLTKRHRRLAELAPRLLLAPNIWMGVSIENSRFLERADYLRQVPAAVRFISAEPLLGSLVAEPGRQLDLTGIDWLITGGESGGHLHDPGRRQRRALVEPVAGGWVPRPDREQWVRELRDACEQAKVAFFFKQWGGPRPKAAGRLLDGEVWSEYPEPAQVVPAAGAALRALAGPPAVAG